MSNSRMFSRVLLFNSTRARTCGRCEVHVFVNMLQNDEITATVANRVHSSIYAADTADPPTCIPPPLVVSILTRK